MSVHNVIKRLREAAVDMERVDRIIKHPVFIENLHKNMDAEKDRRFCRHDMAHFLDVARIGKIIKLEERFAVEDEMVYAAGLLHDIGRHLQYSRGVPHEQASAEIAPGILRECGFGEKEIAVIVEAIACHRDTASASADGLKGILYRADKASRACFSCQAAAECSWKDEKKNLTIRY